MQDISASTTWTYYDAYPIYDYINYLATHNISVNSELKASKAVESSQLTNASYLDQLRWLADTQQAALLGNIDTPNPSGYSLETATLGSISTIAGAALAYKVLSHLATSIEYSGEFYKLSVLTGDFDAFTSFFVLASLPTLNSNFNGLPDFASVMAFELFSTTTPASPSDFPSPADLWVRFLFRNGTDDSLATAAQTGADDGNNRHLPGGLQAYPLFGRGPSETDMQWSDFVTLMQEISIAGPGDWCRMCGTDTLPSLWCAAWNSSLAFATQEEGSSAGKSGGYEPAVVGVIGAVIALALVGFLVCTLLLLGFRFTKVDRRAGRRGGSLGGGFKGARKLGSDTDLSVPSPFKSGVVVGASVERKGSLGEEESAAVASGGGVPVPGGRERVGSWEMKDTGLGGGAFRHMGSSTESVDVIGALPVRVQEQV